MINKTKKILLIEDDQDLAELYDEVLSAKFEVEIDHDGNRPRQRL